MTLSKLEENLFGMRFRTHSTVTYDYVRLTSVVVLYVLSLWATRRATVGFSATAHMVLLNAALYFNLIAAFWIVFRPKSLKEVLRQIGWRPRSTTVILTACVTTLAVGVLAGLIADLVPHPPEITLWDITGKNRLILSLDMFLICISAPFYEEVLFRSLLQPLFTKAAGVVVGIAIQAVIFGAAHVQNYSFHMWPLIGPAIMGAWLGIVRYRTGSVIPGIAAHMLINIAASL